jgi:hypothetical protein
MHSLRYNQQDATLYNILYYCHCSTCFGRFLRPSSGAQNCIHSIWYVPGFLAATATRKSALFGTPSYPLRNGEGGIQSFSEHKRRLTSDLYLEPLELHLNVPKRLYNLLLT